MAGRQKTLYYLSCIKCPYQPLSHLPYPTLHIQELPSTPIPYPALPHPSLPHPSLNPLLHTHTVPYSSTPLHIPPLNTFNQYPSPLHTPLSHPYPNHPFPPLSTTTHLTLPHLPSLHPSTPTPYFTHPPPPIDTQLASRKGEIRVQLGIVPVQTKGHSPGTILCPNDY